MIFIVLDLPQHIGFEMNKDQTEATKCLEQAGGTKVDTKLLVMSVDINQILNRITFI